MSRYRLTTEAQDDLDGILTYVAREASVDRALKLHDLFMTAISKLVGTPGLGHWRPDLLPGPYRFYPVRSYLIVYREGETPLLIIAVVHAARDVQALFEQRRF